MPVAVVGGVRRVCCASAALSSSSSFSFSSSSSSAAIAPSALRVAVRGRFYRPLVNQGINLWRRRMGRLHKGWNTWEYQHTRPDPRPFPEPSVNNYFGRSRLWNPIAGKIGFVNKKAEEWGWPHQRPPPTGLRHSQEYFPFFFERYFPDAEVRLVLDSVLNNETTRPVFHIPSDMSRMELVNYLKNLYGIDNVVSVKVRNVRGRRFKNEVGEIKNMDDYKVAIVQLDAPVSVEFKQLKGTEDTPDNRPQNAQVGDSSDSWSVCTVLTDRLRMLQLRGMALDAKIEQLRSDMTLAGIATDVPVSHRARDLSTAFPLPMEATTPAGASAARRTPASRRSDASASPDIFIEVMDRGSTGPRLAAVGRDAGTHPSPSSSSSSLPSHPHSPPLAAVAGDTRAAEERKAMVSFVLEQIQHINVPTMLASPAADVFRQLREDGSPVGQSKQITSPARTARVLPEDVDSPIVAVVESAVAQHTSTVSQPLSVINYSSIEGSAGAMTTVTLLDTAAAPLLPSVIENTAPTPSLGVVKSVLPVTMEVDYDQLAQEALNRGEWKETKDKKGRLYYYKSKGREVCWNLAKELRLRAEAATPTS